MTRSRSMTLALYLLASPVFLVAGLFKGLRALYACRYAWSRAMRCRQCGSAIALVRAWRCHCGFTYVGSVLQTCPICGSRPVLVRCDSCGVTWQIR